MSDRETRTFDEMCRELRPRRPWRKLFVIPGALFIVLSPIWGIAAGVTSDSFLACEFLVVALAQVIVGAMYVHLAFRR